jgi:hypothetical protein
VATWAEEFSTGGAQQKRLVSPEMATTTTV